MSEYDFEAEADGREQGRRDACEDIATKLRKLGQNGLTSQQVEDIAASLEAGITS